MQRKFSTWGSLNVGDIFVHKKTGVWSTDVKKSLERRLNLICCAGPKVENVKAENGRIIEQTFSLTLGKRLRTGGYEPKGDVWFTVDYTSV